MDRFWIKQYPPGTPTEIDPGEYSSLKALIDGSCEQFATHTAFIQMEQRSVTRKSTVSPIALPPGCNATA